MHDGFLGELARLASNLFYAVLPGALGALVAQTWEKGLSWGDRLVQWMAGIVISYYAKVLVLHFLGLPPFAGDSIGFVIGLVAYKAAPGFQRAAAGVIADLPGLARAWIEKRKGSDT